MFATTMSSTPLAYSVKSYIRILFSSIHIPNQEGPVEFMTISSMPNSIGSLRSLQASSFLRLIFSSKQTNTACLLKSCTNYVLSHMTQTDTTSSVS